MGISCGHELCGSASQSASPISQARWTRVLRTCTTTPLPWHLEHTREGLPFLAPDPPHVLQPSRCEMRTFSSPPKIDVLNGTVRSSRKSSPGTTVGARRRPAPPRPAPRAPPAPVSYVCHIHSLF